jgi:AraC family transcriptional regulator
MFDRVDSYTTESITAFPGGRIEVRHFSWSRPLDSVWETGKRCYLFNLGSFAAGNSRSVCFMLDASVVEALLPDTPEWSWSQALLDDCAHVGGTEIEWLLRRMYREVQKPDFATVAVLEILAKQVAIEIVRKFKLRSCENNCRAGGLAPWRMRLIRERLHSDAPLPHLGELAALCDITVRHLTRAFRTDTGRTLGRYIESVMVERAKGLLQARMPVGQVAKTLGYSHSGAFASAFRRATGVRPSELKMTASAGERHAIDLPARRSVRRHG